MKTFAGSKKRSSRISPPRRMNPQPPVDDHLCSERAAVRRILRGTRLQAKLTIGTPDDVYEQEADRVADAVMRMPEPRVQTAAACSPGGCSLVAEETIQPKPLPDQITPLVQPEPFEVEDEKEKAPAQAKLMPFPIQKQAQAEVEEETEEDRHVLHHLRGLLLLRIHRLRRHLRRQPPEHRHRQREHVPD